MYDWENAKPINDHLADLLPLSFVMVNGTEEELLWDEMIRQWHYLGYNKMIGARVKYLVLSCGQPIAAISFNRASYHVEVRDTWLGWNEEARHELLPHVVNNNRFLILPWIRVKNLASYILSRALRRLTDDWFRLHGIQPYAVETFVDNNRYQGTCYKAANWRYLGETRGFCKVGKAFVYHGNRKGVYFYLLNKKLLEHIDRYPRRPDPKFERVRVWDMMLSKPDWSPTLFAEVGLNEKSVVELHSFLSQYLDYYAPCFSRTAQQSNAETYVKGLLSDLDRKSIEPIALRYQDENAVRTLQMFLKDAPWDDSLMKSLYQARVFDIANDPEGMLTVDGSDHVKKGSNSAGVARQYCGRLGKVENCQAGVYIGYAGKGGYGLLDARLYLPEIWFDDAHKKRWDSCDIPQKTEFKTKPQLALEMISQAQSNSGFQFKWIGCDAAFGCSAEFRKSLPEGIFVFADIHSNQLVFRTRPQWLVPERKSTRGKPPSKLVPSLSPVPVSSIAADESLPWEEIELMDGSKGPVCASVKICRVIEVQDDKDGDESWLYIRKYENGEIRYALCYAPADMDVKSFHYASTLRWPIEQSFQECKSFLGMSDYETRSYLGWDRHMLLVMVAHLFVLEVRKQFQKKTETGDAHPILSMHQALILIIASISQDLPSIQRALRDVNYYQKSYTKSYRSFSKKRRRSVA